MYLLQVTTKDYGLQLRTEVTADTVEQLQLLGKAMVKNNPAVVGLSYIIAKYTKVNDKFTCNTLKTGVINA